MKRKILIFLILLVVPLMFVTAKNANQYVSTIMGGRYMGHYGEYSVDRSDYQDYYSTEFYPTVRGYSFAYGATYTGYIWGTEDSVREHNRARSSGISYHARRYQPAGRSIGSTRGDSGFTYRTIGLSGSVYMTSYNFDVIKRINVDYIGDEIIDTRSIYHMFTFASFGAAFRQRLLDNLFVYESVGLEGGESFIGVYGDAGVTFDWICTFSLGARLSLGYNFYTEGFDFPLLVPYIGIGYSF